MPFSLFPSSGLAFVDIETTGGPAQRASITEIAVIQADEAGVREWSTLVRPDTRIPVHIERLTGISNDMVANAPRFEEIADPLFDRLHGRIFVAHNARFDHSHLKAAFRRMGVTIRPRVLCTVKLSRRLFPEARRHSLDHVIARHGLEVDARHRALGDARVLLRFWAHLHATLPPGTLQEAVQGLLGQATLPPFLDPAQVDALPDLPGVYLFYGDNDLPLYVGKSTQLRTRVLSHFSADHSNDRELSMSQQVRRIEHVVTQGELGALLEEARLIKRLQPTLNRQLRRNRDMCAWQMEKDLFSKPLLRLVRAVDIDPSLRQPLYGIFRSRRAALTRLRELCAEHRLCPPLLGLEKHTPGRCFNHQVRRCEGACLGKEPQEAHADRLEQALSSHKLQAWPHEGPVLIREGCAFHVVDNGCLYGSVADPSEAERLLASQRPQFDLDIYKLLLRMMATHEVLSLPADSGVVATS
ncbi:MAG TPA: exonuclease domain-containing protein [Burkholderiaceae bacterium]|nr:exonuclease domain-containing protein [Burkholderiaceae bacterium]